jgi:hypothetical protein
MAVSWGFNYYYDEIIYHCLLPLISDRGDNWIHQDDEDF